MAAAAPEAQPVLLSLPGPAFPLINFDPSPGQCDGRDGDGKDETTGGEYLGIRFLVGGKPLLLDKQVTVDTDSHTEKTAGSVWDCSLVLAKYLEKHRERLLRGKHVLELGSGQGVVGISCALAGAVKVTLTDVAAALPALEANCKLNGLEVGDKLRVAEVDWTRADKHIAALQD
eukprot:CAMPEP_0114157062 /NCGR_PEP_ID=MMETSP0043_2-20121206/26409_1 /TAXON_ID=464988 /ORGANISM="Hemiselmis andersenii, Strain CCMP644" /LENGTH=173 /DNA_ID=CAMNT_0001252581 /DNA_START=113 /DNA_END=631 /DNA_ORIENTATION=+